MSAKVVMIISTGEREKALTGMMYAKNAVQNDWLEDVVVVFFGPVEKLIVKDDEIKDYAKELSEESECLACKYISDRDEVSKDIEEMGIEIEYVGSIISELIEDGYQPMVW